MSLGFRKFISEVFMNGKFPKISRYTVLLIVYTYTTLYGYSVQYILLLILPLMQGEVQFSCS